MALSSEPRKSTIAAKPKPTVTLKHLAAASAEEHQMTKRASEALFGDLIGMITKHLKKGERVRIAGLGILQVEIARPAWGAIPQPAKQSRSKQAKEVHSVRPRI